MITLEFKESADLYVGYAEMFIIIGILVGPSVGSFFYGLVGYNLTYIIVGILIGINAVVVVFMLPNP